MGSGAQGEAGGWTIRQQKGSPFWFVRFRHEGRVPVVHVFQFDLIAKLGLDGLAGRDIK